jgi:chromosome partitioning protein
VPVRQVIAIVSSKGGVGKTALCGNLGYMLAVLGTDPVCLVDLDTSCGLTLGFSGLVVPEGTSSGSLLQSTADVDACLVSGLPGGMQLVPAQEADLTAAEFALQAGGIRSAYVLRQAIEPLDGIVLLDTPGKANQVFVNALVAADWALISVNPDADSIREATRVLGHVGEVRRYANPGLRVMGVVRNIWEWNTNAARAANTILEEFAEQHDVVLFRSAVPRDTKHREARFLGTLVAEHAPISRVATSFRGVANEVLGVLDGANGNLEVGE